MKAARFVLFVAAAALVALTTTTGFASASPAKDHNCLTPDGTNLNDLLGIKERIIGPPACREAFAGERWARSVPSWETAAGADSAVYPPGYAPEQPNPIDDFNAKFVGARFVQDRGGAQERTFVFGQDVLRTGFVGSGGLPFTAIVSSVFPPLSIGAHTSTVYFTMAATHCDGLGIDPDLNCLPAGTFAWTGDTPFEVFQPGTRG